MLYYIYNRIQLYIFNDIIYLFRSYNLLLFRL